MNLMKLEWLCHSPSTAHPKLTIISSEFSFSSPMIAVKQQRKALPYEAERKRMVQKEQKVKQLRVLLKFCPQLSSCTCISLQQRRTPSIMNPSADTKSRCSFKMKLIYVNDLQQYTEHTISLLTTVNFSLNCKCKISLMTPNVNHAVTLKHTHSYF